MNDKFDELAKGLAQCVTRRGALKKFSVGLAGLALASLGLANKAEAVPVCRSDADCAGLACCKGKCVDLNYDIHNCGSCGNHCQRSHERCEFGVCTPHYPI